MWGRILATKRFQTLFFVPIYFLWDIWNHSILKSARCCFGMDWPVYKNICNRHLTANQTNDLMNTNPMIHHTTYSAIHISHCFASKHNNYKLGISLNITTLIAPWQSFSCNLRHPLLWMFTLLHYLSLFLCRYLVPPSGLPQCYEWVPSNVNPGPWWKLSWMCQNQVPEGPRGPEHSSPSQLLLNMRLDKHPCKKSQLLIVLRFIPDRQPHRSQLHWPHCSPAPLYKPTSGPFVKCNLLTLSVVNIFEFATHPSLLPKL